MQTAEMYYLLNDNETCCKLEQKTDTSVDRNKLHRKTKVNLRTMTHKNHIVTRKCRNKEIGVRKDKEEQKRTNIQKDKKSKLNKPLGCTPANVGMKCLKPFVLSIGCLIGKTREYKKAVKETSTQNVLFNRIFLKR